MERLGRPANDLGPRRAPIDLLPAMRQALVGCVDDSWSPPPWLYPHQRDAAQRLMAALRIFGGALLADQVGLGKTHVALALATTYDRVSAAVPATLQAQWRRVAKQRGVPLHVVSHEALSRGAHLSDTDFVIVDEAHRLRNPETRRYDALARSIGRAHTLLVSATPVVNRSADLIHLVRLFLADNGLAPLGVPSLEQAVTDGDPAALMHALGPLLVGRSANAVAVTAPLPRVRDHAPVEASPLGSDALRQLVRSLDTLRFPSFGREATALLRQHVFYRLASSPAACRETLRRHRRYLDDAIDAARRGDPLTRRAARRLLGTDDTQLLLDLSNGHPHAALPVRPLAAEARRLGHAQRALDRTGSSPKMEALRALVRDRAGHKTLVFTTAEATARAIAAGLDWKALAVVAGGRAAVASGHIALDDALNLFAPRARGRPVPDARLRVDVLVATDFASEGLDLQDADAVVHFDLPWTPLRLEQRLGRIARLHSPHDAVDVWWLVPPRALERRLRLADRIGRKLRDQLRLGVPRSSGVGRATVTSGSLHARERALSGTRTTVRGFAIVGGPRRAVFALRWTVGDRGSVHEMVDEDGKAGLGSPWEILVRAPPRDSATVPAWSLSALDTIRRRRAHAMDRGVTHSAARLLRRRLLRRARLAARRRDHRLLDRLDRVLQRLQAGLPVGAERDLSDLVALRPGGRALDRWLGRLPETAPAWVGPELDAMIATEGNTG